MVSAPVHFISTVFAVCMPTGMLGTNLHFAICVFTVQLTVRYEHLSLACKKDKKDEMWPDPVLN